MTATPAAKTFSPKPVNQSIRIAALRIFFVLAAPLTLFTSSAWVESPWMSDILEVCGVLFVVAAVLGRFWSILYIGAIKNQTVMQDGPYSMCRHPLYLFSTIGVLGFGLMLGSFTLSLFFGLSVYWILSATAAREEGFLRSHFGPAYGIYAARVPRIFPNFSLFKSPATITASVRAIRVNFADALVFLAFIPLAELLQAVKQSGVVPTYPLY
ncbi:MAG: isoprenylcysteine carboxylmethyltransferase family protein [Paracoccaceae bacterium]